MDLFQQFNTKMRRLIVPMVEAEGLTPLQSMVLACVSQGDISVRELSQATNMGQANASTLCKRLEQAGFLTRKRSTEDERMVLLALTEQGEAAMERLRKRSKQGMTEIMRVYPHALEDMARGLMAVQQILDYFDQKTKGEETQC